MSQDVAGKMLKPDFDMEVSGLVYGFLFREGHQPLQITSQQVCSRFHELDGENDFVWLHLNLNHATAEKWLMNHFPVADFSLRRSATVLTPPALSGRATICLPC